MNLALIIVRSKNKKIKKNFKTLNDVDSKFKR